MDERLHDIETRMAINQAQVISAIQQLSDYYRLSERVAAFESKKEREGARLTTI